MNVECSPRPPQRGVALIITLIMLAVITFMATTFLVLSRRERGAVTTNTDQTTARLTADSALERAKVELLGTILGTTNDQNYGLMVPTNYFNPLGFKAALLGFNPTNVDYASANGNLQNLANLIYNPRPPVFVTNRLTGGMDFRFFLNLNRNVDTFGRAIFDPSGRIPEIGVDGLPIVKIVNGLNVTNFVTVTGDPQWVGVLRFPDRPHSADNPFLARWTYLVLPAGQTLDVNYVHNQVLNRTTPLNAINDGFSRNQGVGTWEINLAAFLSDLNTNLWYQDNGVGPNYYQYNQATLGSFNKGVAFSDAFSLLRYRYANSYASLYPARAFFTNTATTFLRDNIDEYADGPYMTTTAGISEAVAGNQDNRNLPWAGSENTNHFLTPQDFFDRSKVVSGAPLSFVDRMTSLGGSNDTYNRYTFYRMLEQLGTDSAPDGRINVNYLNIDANGAVVPGMETNLLAWQPLQFFTNAAAKMFEQLNEYDNKGNPITVTNIPVWPLTNNNFYTPAVHRVLQLAANIYEATTNTIYPCIYRPLFSAEGSPVTNIFISGYELVNGPDDPTRPPLPTPPGFLAQVPVDLNDSAVRNAIAVAPAKSQRNIYGIPWVIGAKKGLPNLNLITMQSVSQITRKLQVTRPLTLQPNWGGFSAKQEYIIGVSNSLAVEVWNSYSNSYPRALYVRADGYLDASLTNNLQYLPAPTRFNLLGTATLAANQLKGSGLSLTDAAKPPSAQSFVVPLMVNVGVQPDSYYENKQMYALTNNNGNTFWSFLPQNNLAQPHWVLNLTNNIRCYVMDGGPAGRVVDYVQLNLTLPSRDLTQEMLNGDTRGLWRTNATSRYWPWPGGSTGLPDAITQQLGISQGSPAMSDTEWSNYGLNKNNKAKEIEYFQGFMANDTITSNSTQVPFTPTAKIYQTVKWQANDPLVHYLADDLGATNKPSQFLTAPNAVFPLTTAPTNLFQLSERYSPWGGYGPKTGWTDFGVDPHMFDTALKDPLVRSSDDWDFPTNKLPNIGWLGRVHRGTPWQTVYMKSADILGSDLNAWAKWTGSASYLLATNIAPIKDRWLFDVFTTSVNGNAARGQLPINQTNLAAWSAVLSGVIVLTNDPVNATYGWSVINPAGIYDPFAPPSPLPQFWPPPVWQIVQGINFTRSQKPLFPNRVFKNLGDVLATPQLSDASPYLLTNSLQSIGAGGISDAVMERIPQQIMGLLTLNHSPRFVVYSYGQALHPADHSLVLGGTFNLLCTNYQITAETATRAVIRVEGSPDSRYAKTPDTFGNTYPPRIVVEQFNVLPPD